MQEEIIISATKADHQELIQIWELSVRATHHFLKEADILRYKHLILNEYFNLVDLYKVEAQHTVKGFLGLSADNIQMLFIHPDFIGKGIGKMLVNFAVREKNASKVDVNEQNTSAYLFYNHLGFKVIERYNEDAAGKPYPVLSMGLQV